MIEERVETFAPCNIEIVAVEQLSLSLTQEGKRRSLVTPSHADYLMKMTNEISGGIKDLY
ncbi:hypothetical protein A8L34_13915 [Bacillus sp. FJAT-27264]|uniref:hypothetical protein n=1 Tax=Paenibacillus sp. (strain DSM 101736 / FJAT-27264) TaxID=1850362 RepID=UPI0008081142|nr:hypothetical protein [Bacillus sp. FJAT-27264]OBZ14972.1 hypothetical protein A8L34_13915 [Bacillus sp. FJAT-27264]